MLYSFTFVYPSFFIDRCLIDAGFGRIKQKYRMEDTDTVELLASVVERSSVSNVAVSYGGWSWRSWKEFLGLRFPNVNSYYYFRFEATYPGAVYISRSAVDTEETRYMSSVKLHLSRCQHVTYRMSSKLQA